RGGDSLNVFERILVTVRPEKPEYGPGELCRLTITTKKDTGDPVPAEIALAVVDEAIFRLAADKSSPIATFFRPSDRPHLVRTGTSLDFRHQGSTSTIPADLLAERDRRKNAAETDDDVPVYLEEEMLADGEDEKFEGPETDSVIGIGGGAGGAFGGRGGHRNLRAEGGGGRTASAYEPRADFEDTAAWRARVRTDAAGKAVVEFTLPDDLTEWRITARGASRGNACGEARATVTTSRPLVVRSALPRFLREGDELLAAAGVVNGTDRGLSADVTLRTGEEDAARAAVALEPGEERHVDWPMAGAAPGRLSCEARAEEKDGELADAERREVSVLAFGVPFRSGFAGLSKDPGERGVEVPDDFVPGTLSLTLHVAPSLARAALDGLADLEAFPHGCTEQTVNRFLPALEAAAAIRELGLSDGDAIPGLEKTARAGALRLTYLRNRAGLWGWWAQGNGHPQMTAYALLALGRARQAGIGFSPAVIPAAVSALGKWKDDDLQPDDLAFLHYARSVAARAAGRADFMRLSGCYADRARLGARGIAHLLLAYQALGEAFQIPVLAGDLAGRLERPSQFDTETLGWALLALAADDANSKTVGAIADEILLRRQGRGFGTTRETGAVVMGLARLARARGLTETTATFTVLIDGAEVASGPVPPGALHLPAGDLAPGRHRVEVRFDTAGTISYAVSLEGIRRTPPAGTSALTLSRKHTLVPWVHDPYASFVESPIRGARPMQESEVSVVRTGELVRVTLEVENRDRLDHLVVSDALPAGFEPVAWDAKSTGASESVRYDDRILFFFDRAPKRVRITYLLRGEAPGRMRIPPAIVFAMYRPSVAAWSSAAALDVAGPDDEIDRDPLAGLWATDLWDLAMEKQISGDAAGAAEVIEALFVRFKLPHDSRRAAFRMLARIRQSISDHAAAVACFERLRARDTGFATTLDDEKVLAASFMALGRHGDAIRSLERAAWLLYGTEENIPSDLEASARVALRARLLDRYPFSPYVAGAWSALANSRLAVWEAVAERGGEPSPDDLGPMEEFIARYPDSVQAPPGAFRLVRTRLRSKRWADLARESAVFAERWPDHVLADDADWFRAFALFAERRYDEAEAVARSSLAKEYRTKDGRKAKTGFERNLIHMRAQVAHIRGRMKEAAELYRQVAEYTPDARESLRQLTEKRMSVAEVTRAAPGEKVALPLTARNVGEVILDVYAIDLLTYFTLTK
ncbi:MAG: alpha-2-macroglobulin family protein, partial [Planctomycetota bacterium]